MEKREIKHFTYFGRLEVEAPLKKKQPETPSFPLPAFLPVYNSLRHYLTYSLHDIIRPERPEKGKPVVILLAPFKVM